MNKAQIDVKKAQQPNSPVQDYQYHIGMSIMLEDRGYSNLARSHRMYADDQKYSYPGAFRS